MTAMSSATPRFSCIKMLIVFALLVTVASAVSTEVVRSSPAFNTSTLTSNSTSAKPYLRPDAVMTTSDDAISLSERSFTPGFAAIQQFGTRLKLTLVKYFRKLLWQLDKTFMEKAFITLKLNQPKDGLLESHAFLIWANSLRYYEDPPVKNIFSILTRHYDDQDLAKLLVAVKNVDSTKPLVTRLALKWAHKSKTSTEIFKLLELDKSGENFLNNPLVSVWSHYVTLCGFGDPTTVMLKTMAETIGKPSIIRAVIRAHKDSELAIRLRDAEFERLLAEHETLEGVEKELSKFTDEVGKKALYRFQKFYGKLKVTEPISKEDAHTRKNSGIHIN